MLADVRRLTAAMFVATLKPKVYADRIVRHLGLARHFAGVYGPELEGRFDGDKTELLAHLLTVEGIAAERAVMIGDRAVDIVAARANRVRSIGVLWGYGSRAELIDARADGLCPSPGDLAASLAELAV
jgi:phosphoglycolate phosphatase